MVHVRDLVKGSCQEDCGGHWLQLALEALRRTKINKYVHAGVLRELLEKERGKHRNIIIVGLADSDKTFMLQPLTMVFKNDFTNPPSSQFALILPIHQVHNLHGLEQMQQMLFFSANIGECRVK